MWVEFPGGYIKRPRTVQDGLFFVQGMWAAAMNAATGRGRGSTSTCFERTSEELMLN
jgi:hypothetical protein